MTRFKPSEIPDEWVELFRLIPGYDPISTAGDAVFDAEEASKSIEFFPLYMRHVEGDLAGEPFVLERWQQAIVACIKGWQRQDRPGRWVRRYREAFILVPRKNGKSPLAAGLSIDVFFRDKMKGKQCYLSAGDRSQAGIVFRHAKGIVEQNETLRGMCRIYGGTGSEYQTRSIVREEEHSFLRVISADASTKHGGNTYLAVIDELHVQPNRDLVDVLSTSMASANISQALMVYLTTADFERESICNEKHDYARRVRDGDVDDPAFLPVLYEATLEDDWTDPEVWRSANPNLGVSVSLDYLERECKHAQEVPAFENTFKRLHLNIRTQQDVRAIPMDKWDACGTNEKPLAWRERMLNQLQGQKCVGGLDLGAVSDLTALALLFGDDIEGFTVLPFFWCPQQSAHKRSRTDGVDYVQWANAGFITLTEGNEVHYGKVIDDIDVLADQFGIHEIAADRLFQGAQLCQSLTERGMNVTAMGQGYVSMAAPTRRFLELLNEGKLSHGSNPVLRWMAGNTACESQNKSGEILKFSKAKSTEKIDGIIAIANALCVAMKLREFAWDFQPGSLAV